MDLSSVLTLVMGAMTSITMGTTSTTGTGRMAGTEGGRVATEAAMVKDLRVGMPVPSGFYAACSDSSYLLCRVVGNVGQLFAKGAGSWEQRDRLHRGLGYDQGALPSFL